MSQSRIAGLDGLRALAVALVVVDHATTHFVGGGVGVCVFFVLSGYLITSLLLAEHRRLGHNRLGLFYARRVLRLCPALFVMLAVCTVALGASARSAGIAASYSTDIVDAFGHVVSPFGHTWSLGVEEQFYLLWPLALPFVISRRRAGVAAVVAATVVSVVGCQLWTLHSLHTSGSVGVGVFNPVWQGHGLLIGCLLALTGERLRVARPAQTALGAGGVVVGIAVLASWTAGRHWALWWNLAAELVTVVAIVALRAPARSPYTWKPVVWAGTRSYAIYLWHFPLLWYVAEHDVRFGRPLAVVATLVAAELSAHFVEAPFLRLKDRLHARPLVAPVALAAAE